MEKEIVQAAGGVAKSMALALPALYVAGGYFFLAFDRQRANSPNKDDTQAGLKLVLFGLLIGGLVLVSGGLIALLSWALGGFKEASANIKLVLPPILVGAGVTAGVALGFLPRTNVATYRQAERYALGYIGLLAGLSMIASLNLVVLNLFQSQPWSMTSAPLAELLVTTVIALVAIIRLGSLSGWTAPVRPLPPQGYPPQGGQSGGYPPQGGYGQQGGYPQQGGYGQQGGYPPQGGGYPPQGGGYPPAA